MSVVDQKEYLRRTYLTKSSSVITLIFYSAMWIVVASALFISMTDTIVQAIGVVAIISFYSAYILVERFYRRLTAVVAGVCVSLPLSLLYYWISISL